MWKRVVRLYQRLSALPMTNAMLMLFLPRLLHIVRSAVLNLSDMKEKPRIIVQMIRAALLK